MKKSLFSILLISIISSCSLNLKNPHSNSKKIRGNGYVITEEIDVSFFHSVNLNTVVELNIIHGERFTLTLTGDDNLLDLIEVEIKGNELCIYSTKENIEFKNVSGTITMPEPIKSATVSSIGKMKINTQVDPVQFRASISGIGKVEINNLNTEELIVDMSGMGNMVATGKATSVKIDNSGMGKIQLNEVIASRVICDNSGMGKVEVHVSDYFKGNVSGMGGITYSGNPKEVRTEISGMGKITKK